MQTIKHAIKLAICFCLFTTFTNVKAQSLDFTFGEGTIFPEFPNTETPIFRDVNTDLITFAFANNLLLFIDDSTVFNSSIGDIVFLTNDFDVGSVSPNNLGGQNITFINGVFEINDGQGNLLATTFTTEVANNAVLQVQTTNLSFQDGDPIFVNNGAFSAEGLTLLDFVETVEAIAQLETEQEISENTNKVTSGVVNDHISSAIASAFQPPISIDTAPSPGPIDIETTPGSNDIETAPDIETTPGSNDIDSDSDSQVKSQSNRLAASADSNYLPDAFWGKHTYSALSEDGDNLGYTTDLYQFVGGLDKRLGDFFIGSAVSYVYGETNQAGNNSSTHTIGVTPYAAYRINNFLFASALAGYNYTSINGTQGRRDADVHNYSGEVSLNAYKAIDAFVVKGRGGLRYTHNYTSLKGSIDADYDQLTWIADIEFAYQINDKFNVFSGILYEYIDKEATVGTSIGAVNAATHDGVAYFRGGVNYKFNDSVKFHIDASSDLNDEDNDILSFGAGINIAL